MPANTAARAGAIWAAWSPYPSSPRAASNRSISIYRRWRPSSCAADPMTEAKPIVTGTQSSAEGRVRAVIDVVLPAVDGGRFPVKRIAGETVDIEAHCFTDGHDKLRVVLRWRRVGASDEYEVEMKPHPNDVWVAQFTPPRAGRYRYSVVAWVDHFE